MVFYTFMVLWFYVVFQDVFLGEMESSRALSLVKWQIVGSSLAEGIKLSVGKMGAHTAHRSCSYPIPQTWV
jgi:hypothetical protein